MKETIFFVEDDPSINALLKATLEANEYNVKGFLYPLDFLDEVSKTTPDLVLLDLMLPQMSGYEVLAKMQNDLKLRNVPVIILSALSDETNIVKGLDDGAVDYMPKPFGLNELLSRVRANLRKNKSGDVVLTVRNLSIDTAKFTCKIGDEPLQLTSKEYELLLMLVQNKDHVIERQVILQRIWGFDCEVETRTLDMHVKTLRQKIANVTKDSYIETVRSVGYVIYE